jgi:tetratricopeptide (TPR) repeat protein
MSPLDFVLSSMSQHRVFQALFLAYISFFYKVFEEASRPQTEPAPPTGTQLLDSDDLEPLKRSSGSNVVGGPRMSAGPRTSRKEQTEEEGLAAWEALHLNDTEAEVFERNLRAAAAIRDEVQRGRHLTIVYRGLANSYSARGKYLQALHAMDLALGAAEAGQCPELQGQAHMALGQLELKHHRYYAAETRFDDAAKLPSSSDSQQTMAVRCGHGWAALMQGKTQQAEERFSTALEIAEFNEGSSAFHQKGALFLNPKMMASCRPRGDGLDVDRAMALLGLGLAMRQRDPTLDQQIMDTTSKAVVAQRDALSIVPTTAGGAEDHHLFACASLLMSQKPSMQSTDPRTPIVWNAIGYAKHLLGHHHDALELHRRAHNLQQSHPGVRDLPAASHTLLYLGLVKYGAGHKEQGSIHVDELLASDAPGPEIAEWMVRFARAHTHGSAPVSDQDYGAYLFTRALDIVKSIGGHRQIKHLIDFGRFYFGLRPPRLTDALEALTKAAKVIDVSARDYPSNEQAALYNLIAAIQHRMGNVDEALEFFNQALSMDLYQAQYGSKQVNYEKLMVSYSNVGAMRLQRAGTDIQRWKAVVEDFRNGMSVARASGLPHDDPRMISFKASYNNIMRLAHKQGVFQTCLGQLETLLYGPQCTSMEDDA